MRLTNCDSKRLRAFNKAFIHVVGSLEIISSVSGLVDHNPFIFGKVDNFLNWKSTHHIFIYINDLVLFKDLGFRENGLVTHLNWIAGNG